MKLTGPAERGTSDASTHLILEGEQEVTGYWHNLSSCLYDGRYKGTLSSVLSKVDMDFLWDFSGRKPFWIGGCQEG